MLGNWTKISTWTRRKTFPGAMRDFLLHTLRESKLRINLRIFFVMTVWKRMCWTKDVAFFHRFAAVYLTTAMYTQCAKRLVSLRESFEESGFSFFIGSVNRMQAVTFLLGSRWRPMFYLNKSFWAINIYSEVIQVFNSSIIVPHAWISKPSLRHQGSNKAFKWNMDCAMSFAPGL